MELPDYGPVREVPSIKGKHPVIQYDSRLNPGHVYEFVFNRYVERTATSYYVCLGCRSMKRKDKLHQLPPATRVTVVNGRITCNPESYAHFCVQPKKGLSAGKRALYTLSQSLSTKKPHEGVKLAYESAIDGLKSRNDLSIEEQHEAQMVMLGKGGYASKRRGLDKAAEKFKFCNSICHKPQSDSEDAQADEDDDAQWELAEKRARLENGELSSCSQQAATAHVLSTALVSLTSIVDPKTAHLKGRGELVKLETVDDDYEQPSTSTASAQQASVKLEAEETNSASTTTIKQLSMDCAGCLLDWLNGSTGNWDQLKVGMISLVKEVLEEGLTGLDSAAQEEFWTSVDRMASVEDKGLDGQKTASLQNQFLLLSFSFFSHDDLAKKQLILKNLPNIAKNQVVTRQILKFLFALSRTTSKQLAFEVVAELWAKHNWILNEAEMEQHFVRLDPSREDEEISHWKMSLIRHICKVQQGEYFVPQLLNLLLIQPEHTEKLMAEAVLALTDLCRQCLLKVDKVKTKVEPVLKEAMNGSDVKWPKVVSAYCHLLSTSAVDKEDYNLAVKYVEELWQLKDNAHQEVSVSAWNALAVFPLSTLNAANLACSSSAAIDLSNVKIEESTANPSLTGTQLLSIAKGIQSNETFQAFTNFLHQVIKCEVEDLPKPFYTDCLKQEAGTDVSSSTLLLVNLMPVLRETLENGGTACLDLAGFALAEPITKHLQPNTKRMAKCTHLLSYALLKARADSNFEFGNTLNYLASWKSGLEFSFPLFYETRKKSNMHFTVAMARDMFIDVMQKAMDQVQDAAVNVVFCLPFLWNTMNGVLAECPAESTDMHWQISVVEYLLILAIEDYKPKTMPIFQKETMRTCQLSAAAFFSLALILQRHSLDYYTHAKLPELILRNISTSCPAWMEHLIKGLLLPADQLPLLTTPKQSQPECKIKLEPLDELDMESEDLSSPHSTSNKVALSRVVSSLVNNTEADIQAVHLVELCEGRHNFKALANILDVDPLVVANLLDELPYAPGLQDQFKSMAKDSNLAEVANLKTAFQLFSELSEQDHLRFGNQFARRIEKTITAFSAKTAANQRTGLASMNNNKNMVAECASCCLCSFYVSNLPGRLANIAKKNVKELPEGSVLKEVLNDLRINTNAVQKEMLLKSLLNHLRSDGKSLPPIDWSVLYSAAENNSSAFYTNLFQLAVEQRSAKLVTKLLQAKHLNFQKDLITLCPVLTSNLECLQDLLPGSTFAGLLDSLLTTMSLANYPAPATALIHRLVQMCSSSPLVRSAVWRHAPPLQNASLLLHPFYLHFADCLDASTCPNEFKVSFEHNPVIQAWLEAKKKSKMNVQKIVTLFTRNSVELKVEQASEANITASSLLVLAKCSMDLSNKERLAFLVQLIPMLKILKVSFHSRNSLKDHKSIQVYFDLLVALVVSATSLSGLPFHFLDTSSTPASTWSVAVARFPVLFREFVTQLLAAERGSEGLKEVVIYLVELYSPNCGLSDEQKKALKACLRSCVNFAPQMSIEPIEAAGIWEELFH